MAQRVVEGTGGELPVRFTPGSVTVTPQGVVIDGWRVEGVDLAIARQYVIGWAIQQLASAIYQGPTTYRAGQRLIEVPDGYEGSPTLRSVPNEETKP